MGGRPAAPVGNRPRDRGDVVSVISGIFKARREAHKSEGVLAQTFRAAMAIWDAQKAQGVSEADRQKGLEQSLRAAWPQTREWHYLCQKCDDSGFVFGTCVSGSSCGRPFSLPQQHSDDWTGRGKCTEGHVFAQPCWCSKGAGIRRMLEKRPAPVSADDFTQAGRSKPTKVGR